MIGIEELQPADWALVALTVILAVLGLFRGFSGTLAFVAAIAAALFSVTPSWDLSEYVCDSLWLRRVITLVVVLISFGLVRWLVKKFVNGLLHQPSDAIFGFLLGIISGIAAAFIWSFTGLYTEFSTIATTITKWLA